MAEEQESKGTGAVRVDESNDDDIDWDAPLDGNMRNIMEQVCDITRIPSVMYFIT